MFAGGREEKEKLTEINIGCLKDVPNSDARAVTVRRWLELVALAPLGLREI